MRRRLQSRVSSRALLHAVALQDHMTRSFGMSLQQQQQQQQQDQLTLAQQFGLVNKPRDSLTEEEWRTVHEQSVLRKDALHGCPICHESFLMGEQLLLSCSHVFHQQCLKRFEKFSKQRCCPICRAEHYQTMAIKTPSTVYKSFVATRIQTAFRAYKCRKFYADYKWTHPPSDPSKRKEWFAKKLESATDRLLHQMAAKENHVNLLLADIDSTLACSKQIYDSLGNRPDNKTTDTLELNDVDWHLVIEKAIEFERYDTDCSICIMPLQKDGGENLALLSCSHLFHAQCISEFEAFHGTGASGEPAPSELLCPICRSMYQRLDL